MVCGLELASLLTAGVRRPGYEAILWNRVVHREAKGESVLIPIPRSSQVEEEPGKGEDIVR